MKNAYFRIYWKGMNRNILNVYKDIFKHKLLFILNQAPRYKLVHKNIQIIEFLLIIRHKPNTLPYNLYVTRYEQKRTS